MLLHQPVTKHCGAGTGGRGGGGTKHHWGGVGWGWERQDKTPVRWERVPQLEAVVGAEGPLWMGATGVLGFTPYFRCPCPHPC